jgi:hypothetical protein
VVPLSAFSTKIRNMIMKKMISLMVGALIAVSTVHAGDAMFFGSGATGVDVVVQKVGGSISAQDVLFSIETNATVTVYRAKASAGATTNSTGTTITLPTSATNTIRGVVLTTNDYLIVGSTLLDIVGLAPAEGGLSTVVTNGASATVGLLEAVYIAEAGDNVTLAANTSWAAYPIPFLVKGFINAPIAISVPAGAGATMISGSAVAD